MSDFGIAGSATLPETAQGGEAPLVRQFSLFVENRPGVLRYLLTHFHNIGTRLVAINIQENTDYAIIRTVFDDSDRARQVITQRKIRFFENELLVVAMPDNDDGLVSVCSALFAAEINIMYAYPLLVRPMGRQAMAFRVENLDSAADCLRECHFGLLDEFALRNGL